MSEEEKKAIEWFKSDLEMTKEMGKKWGFQEEIKNNEIILNLIEKQQKEIKELKENELLEITENFVSKDKIREFIKKELPDDEAIKYYTIWNVNGIDLRKKLEKLLEEDK